MSQSDESKDDDLRRLLTDAFTRYEPQPDPSLWQRIKPFLPTRKPVSGWVAGLILALLLLVGWYSYRYIQPAPIAGRQHRRSPQTGWTNESEPVQPASASIAMTTVPTRLVGRRSGPVGNPDEINAIIVTHQSAHRSPSRPARSIGKPGHPVRFISHSTHQTVSRLMTKKAKSRPLSVSLTRTPAHEAGTEAPSETKIEVSRLSIRNGAFGRAWSLPGIPPVAVAMPVSEPTRKSQPIWFGLAASPLQTFGMQRITGRSETYVQNVSLPRLFTKPMNGYQLSASLTRNQWQLNLSVTHTRQWAFYEVATNQFRVDSVDATRVQVVRLGTPMNNITSQNMAGLGLSRQFILWQRQSTGIIADAGAEVGWLIGTGRLSAFATVSAGLWREIVPGWRVSLSPKLRYGLQQQPDVHELIQIRPYTVGLTVGVHRQLGK